MGAEGHRRRPARKKRSIPGAQALSQSPPLTVTCLLSLTHLIRLSLSLSELFVFIYRSLSVSVFCVSHGVCVCVCVWCVCADEHAPVFCNVDLDAVILKISPGDPCSICQDSSFRVEAGDPR